MNTSIELDFDELQLLRMLVGRAIKPADTFSAQLLRGVTRQIMPDSAACYLSRCVVRDNLTNSLESTQNTRTAAQDTTAADVLGGEPAYHGDDSPELALAELKEIAAVSNEISHTLARLAFKLGALQ